MKLSLDSQDQELYALKMIAKTRSHRPGRAMSRSRSSSPVETEDDVVNEIIVMKQLQHPNIVRLIEVIGTSLQLLLDQSSSDGSVLSSALLPVQTTRSTAKF